MSRGKIKISATNGTFPHLQMITEKSISISKEIELLKERKNLGSSKLATFNQDQQLERVELEILLLRTDRELGGLFKKKNDTDEYLKNYLTTLEKLLVEIETEWEEIEQKSIELAKNKKVLQLKETFTQFDFTKNYEAKLMYFAELKKIVSKKTK